MLFCVTWRNRYKLMLCFQAKAINILLGLTTYITHTSNSKYTLSKIKSSIFIETRQVELDVTRQNDKSNIFRPLGFPVLFYQSYRHSQTRKHFCSWASAQVHYYQNLVSEFGTKSDVISFIKLIDAWILFINLTIGLSFGDPINRYISAGVSYISLIQNKTVRCWRSLNYW